MKKLITILGAGLLAFGMFTSCGAKDVNLSWSDESTTYEYTYDVTAATYSVIDEPNSFSDQETAKANALLYTTSYAVTPRYATVGWTEGYAGKDASKTEKNVESYTIHLYYDLETTTTEIATGNISKSYSRGNNREINIEKIDDKYYINHGANNQAEVTIDGDIEDDEFTFSVDIFTVSYENSWKADGSTEYYKGDSAPVKKVVRDGVSLSNVTLVRK